MEQLSIFWWTVQVQLTLLGHENDWQSTMTLLSMNSPGAVLYIYYLLQLKWYIDGSYAAHYNKQDYSGAALEL